MQVEMLREIIIYPSDGSGVKSRANLESFENASGISPIVPVALLLQNSYCYRCGVDVDKGLGYEC